MLLYVLAGLALADTTVVLQPEEPLTGEGPTAIKFAADGTTFPAGEDFVLSIPIANSALRGKLAVWPKVLSDTCGEAPEEGNQLHRLALSTASDGKALQATVPALQVGQPYCVAVELKWPIGVNAWNAITARVAEKLAPPAGAPGLPDCSEAALEAALAAELATEVAALGVTNAAPLATSLSGAYTADTGGEACKARVSAEAKAKGDEMALAPQEAEVVKRAVVVAAAAPVSVRFEAPLVFVAGRVRPITDLVNDGAVTNEALAAALLQLRANRAANLDGWEKAIRSVLTAPDAARTTALAKVREGVAAPKGYAGEALLFYTDAGEAVDPTRWLASPGSGGLSVAAARAQIVAAKGWRFVGARDKQQAELEKLADALAAYEAAVKAREGLLTRVKASRSTLDEKSKAVHDIVLGALRQTAVRESVTVSAELIKVTTGAAGGIKTPSVPNYAAIQTGLAVALPGTVYTTPDATPSFIPYVGVNLYAQPVDRDIDLKYLVGSTFWQRMSLMFGFTLTTDPLNLPGRTTEAAFGTWYPVTGASLRLHNYVNVTGGAVLYRLPDANPASRDAPLRATPFVALSVDADVVKLLADAIP